MLKVANFIYDHPRGRIYGWFSDRGLASLELPSHVPRRLPVLRSSLNAHLVWRLHDALTRYFARTPESFAGIPLDLERGTPFQRMVWAAAREISWGETCTYGALAARIGKPGAARAVGQALGANPVAILVPCHRVLAADGSFGGFRAGSFWKRELLRVEGMKLRKEIPLTYGEDSA